MPRRTRTVTETEAIRELDAAVAALDAAEIRLQKAIIDAAREASTEGSDLTFAEIARRSRFSREYVSRKAKAAGIRMRESKHE